MKYVIYLAIGVAGIFGAVYYFSMDETPTSGELISFIREGIPSEDVLGISLEECQFTISDTRFSNNQFSGDVTAKAYFSADLSLYEFHTVKIGQLGNGQTILTAQRKKPGKRLLKQAEKLNKLATPLLGKSRGGKLTIKPATGGEITEKRFTQSEAEGLDTDALRKIFEMPNGTITYRVTSVATSDANGENRKLQPSKDAPEFHAFAEAAIALDSPKTLTVNLTYTGKEPRPDRLLAGLVTIPPQFRLPTSSQENAKRLMEMLYLYTQANCPSK